MSKFLKAIFLFSIFTYTVNVKAGDKNLAQYRVVFHSSSADQNHCGHLVVDGNEQTYWESKPGGSNSIKIDLSKSRKIHQIIIHWGENYGTEYVVTAYPREDSENVVLYSTQKGTGGKETIDCNLNDARFFKIDVSKVKDPIRGCVINEVEIMGEGEDHFMPSTITTLSENNLSLNLKIWRIQNASFIKDEPKIIADSSYDDTNWIPASVPGIVMGSYFNFGALPDPLYGDNMRQISDEFFSGNDFWYRTSVRLPESLGDRHVFLDFSGINWKTDIYFNSKYLGKIEGAYQRAEFEISQLLNKTGVNTIAMLVRHPEHWESSTHKVTEKTLGARTTNGDVLGLDSPACLASAGWNWLPVIRGRNIGIWNGVTFRIAGNVSIVDPRVSSTMPLPDTTKADLTIRTGLKNHRVQLIKGKLIARFGKTKLEKDITLNSGESKEISLDSAEFEQLAITNPKLWWPNGYGQQNLHQLTLQFLIDGKISDEKQINFGIRQIDYKVENKILFLYCNGQCLLLRGGNWGLPEAMMRCDSLGYDTRVKLHKDANFNIIRNWVGMTGHEAFYDACDRYGLLIFDDFWLANPFDGPDPKDTAMFMNNVRDKIKWVRKHPSLALYCGRNEGLPPVSLDVAMKHETEILDGTRHYIPHSAAGTVTGLGPYDVRTSKWYFENRGKTFHTEQGIIAFPEVESMRRMMPAKDWWPINNMWAVHDYQWGRSERFTDTVIARFGAPTSVEDYCRRAQLQNYESAKAIFECLRSHQGSGLLIWMSQAAWPSLICQLYDHFFEYTASFFATKKACRPVHIFWNALTNKINIANNTLHTLKNITAKAVVFDANGQALWEKSMITDVGTGLAKPCFGLEYPSSARVNFLRLYLEAEGKPVVDNFYWLENKSGNCLDLNNLPDAEINMAVNAEIQDGFYTAEITLSNTSSSVSLLNKIKLKEKGSGESILPVFFDDDYVSLLPGENKTIHLRVDEKLLRNKEIEMYLEGWNTKPGKFRINPFGTKFE